ncbi:MAG: SDR family NAD-dependent epimerase/dehydratase, partial [Phycisphaerales bacterium]
DEATGPINLGNPGEFTMLELANLVLELTGGNSKLIMKPLPADDPTQRQPDITLAKTTLGWEPTIPLKEGLQRTINWFASTKLSEWTPPTPNWEGGLVEST